MGKFLFSFVFIFFFAVTSAKFQDPIQRKCAFNQSPMTIKDNSKCSMLYNNGDSVCCDVPNIYLDFPGVYESDKHLTSCGKLISQTLCYSSCEGQFQLPFCSTVCDAFKSLCQLPSLRVLAPSCVPATIVNCKSF